ncbi:MAG: nucleoside triphosphate pyrophosphohydrolase family protein [Saprospiraceae bacterium]|nr:nucleoside triphosphate pyrophosphohydrolase family protein [Saprospiraceae bacterium]
MKKFDEPNALSDVAKFHDIFDLPVLPTPRIPDSDRCRLRINLLEEELRELKEAIRKKDIVEAADAFADLQYVLSGAILEFGLAPAFKQIFEEVQRSNMSKVCETKEDAEATLAHYKGERGMEGEIVEKEGQFLVYRVSDRKVLKSICYSEAKLREIVESHLITGDE